MDFNDRLRNQLHGQSDDLHIAPEGSDAVRNRSRRRGQLRTGATIGVCVLVALAVGGWMVGRSGDVDANLATDGGLEASAPESAPGVSTAPTAPDSRSIETALPEAGNALVLSMADNAEAPGGYNVFSSGRTDGLYYVLSTAPGVTYDDFAEDAEDGLFIRNDTVYTFDGSSWSHNTVTDRFISTLDTTDSGLLYTVSTGTATGGRSLEFGISQNGGSEWSWTELDPSSVFGPDPSSWPPYVVQFATRGADTFVIAHTRGEIDWYEAAQLAAANGAAIDPDSSFIVDVDASGITWIEDSRDSNPCLAALDEALTSAWENEPEGLEFEFDRELTDAEQAELDEYWAAEDQRADEIYATALDSVGRIPGCEAFVKCTNEHDSLSDDHNDELLQIYEDNDGDELTEESFDALDALDESFTSDVAVWADESGCGEVTPHLVGEIDEGETMYASWDELGVEPADNWQKAHAGFFISNGEVTNLGEVFGDQDGYLTQVRATTQGWEVTFDESSAESPPTSYTTWRSTDGIQWSSTTGDTFDYAQGAALDNGTTVVADWSGEVTQLVRRTPDGEINALTLADLAPELDTTGYQIMNVRSGTYGVVAWAVRWDETSESGSPYDSIVVYSPDGVGWGATAVHGVEVVDTIVGDDDVVVFLNDPDRGDGVAQPIMVGQV